MSPEMFLSLFDWIGVFVFAVSGGLIAVRQRMDIFGVVDYGHGRWVITRCCL